MSAGLPAEQLLIDHHCHGVLVADLDRPAFESLMNEATAPSPLGTSFFESAEGLALRRWCPPLLDLEPLSSADDYLARRREVGADEVARRFLRATSTSDYLVDAGYAPDGVTSSEQLAAIGGGRGHEILRLETAAQDLLAAGVRPTDVPDRLRSVLTATTAVGAKSIAAYRVGLALPAAPPAPDAVVAALEDLQPELDGSFRIAHPVINGWLAWTAIEAGLPLQFHVGYGDSDVRLRECDPLLLTDFLRATEDRGVPVMLLHNYPFHRNAAYLAQVFSHVFMDLGLATHNTGALSGTLVREALELVPFGKLLYSSDAYGLPELYFLAATLFRRALGAVLRELLAAGDAAAEDAERLVRLVSAENARRVYRLT